jgi:hypothetical protein
MWFWRERTLRRKRFATFVGEHLALTKRYRSCKELVAAQTTYDAVITGSDQVLNWQLLSHEEAAAYCLNPFDVARTMKIAFAASTGGAADESLRPKEMVGWLSSFHALSMREQSGAEIVRSLTGRDVPLMADPVFLLGGQQWREVSANVSGVPREYVLCYALNGRQSLGEIALKVSRLSQLPVVLVTDKVRTNIQAECVVRNAGPAEFLRLMDQSQFVVSDSFHGAALAVVFRRPFFSHIALQSASCRIEQLTRDIGYENRIIGRADEVTSDLLSVDWDRADRFVERSVDSAFRYLMTSLPGVACSSAVVGGGCVN